MPSRKIAAVASAPVPLVHAIPVPIVAKLERQKAPVIKAEVVTEKPNKKELLK